MQAHGIFETALYVTDIDRAENFYSDVLGLQKISKDSSRHAFFHCGNSVLLLFRADATRIKTSDVPTHGTEGEGHVAFKMESNKIDEWRSHLKRCGVEIETEITWANGSQSIYFRDPDNNSLELACENVWPKPLQKK